MLPKGECPFCGAPNSTKEGVIGAVTYLCDTSWVIHPKAEPQQSAHCVVRQHILKEEKDNG